MAQRKTSRPSKTRKKAPSAAPRDVAGNVAYALEWLERRGTKKNRDGMARYGIVADKVFGVSMSTMQSLARELGRDHKLSEALWKTGWYEARMLASLVGEPDRVTPAQMERWARSFDNWAVCDTATFVLWDRTPHAWGKVREWSGRKEEFVKRAAFAMLASLTVHDKKAPDEPYLAGLKLVEREAVDDRNFVKKAVNWALRSIGKRSRLLNKAAIDVARRLAESTEPAARWVGKDALRELTSASVQRRVKER
ncbi:MAG TPA: DNA alkylation repair protein [Gemmatimonadaceae bacterium]|nr:DNA alkylation repair protein [Gemmatimonadaceae bacterium]